MVGNDMERDIVPAKRLGLATFHIDEAPASKSGPEADFHGDLQDLRSLLELADPSKFEPSYKSLDLILSAFYLPRRPCCGGCRERLIYHCGLFLLILVNLGIY